MRPAQARARGEQTREAVISSHTSAYGNETHQEERVSLNTFPPGVEPSKVRVSLGKTISLGNFEFLRIDVEMSSPCLESNKHETFEQAVEFVADKLLNEEREWLGTLPKKPQAKRR